MSMQGILKKLEKGIVVTVLVLLTLAVMVATVELGVILAQQLREPPFLLLDLKELLEVFGFFLLVLIGIELMETVRAYLEEDKVHVEVVLLVAMVAVARKVIILEYSDIRVDLLLGMAALLLSLACGYYLVKRALEGPS
jgi:uncharacterized membrane protein (DUF373 family)